MTTDASQKIKKLLIKSINPTDHKKNAPKLGANWNFIYPAIAIIARDLGG